ncbi:MAG TPA: SRPBCC domain-containing protein [Candidatus Kapabacteria bacterium]|jgi:uncharacterized protein YndB with AHSA1/START domain|nr:SRPBCC domain-containing protein [Candidatus Kapabacteria bacterium]
MTTKNEMTVEVIDNEVIVRRLIHAPRELVFDAFTKAEHLSQWFGPHGFETTAETDPREGGAFRIVMHATDALPAEFQGDYPNSGVYKEFKRPEKLVFTSDLSEHSETWKARLRERYEGVTDRGLFQSVATVTFEEKGGKTLVTVRSRFASNNIRDAYVETGMNQGWSECFDRLGEYLERVPV